jgi:hypothetical protein
MKSSKLEYFYASIILLGLNKLFIFFQNDFIARFILLENGENKAKFFVNLVLSIFSLFYIFLGYGSYKKEQRKNIGLFFMRLVLASRCIIFR